jgi:hypothetical protein
VQCLVNIQAILGEASSSLDKLISVTILLADEEDSAGMNEEWLRWFPSDPPGAPGCRAAGAHPRGFDGPIDRVVQCNCTICSKKGALHHAVDPSAFRLHAGDRQLATYTSLNRDSLRAGAPCPRERGSS